MFQQSLTLACFSHHKNKPLTPGNLPINEALSDIGQDWTEKDFQFLVLSGFFNRSIIVKKPFIHKQAARLCNKHSDNCTCQTEQDTTFRQEK